MQSTGAKPRLAARETAASHHRERDQHANPQSFHRGHGRVERDGVAVKDSGRRGVAHSYGSDSASSLSWTADGIDHVDHALNVLQELRRREPQHPPDE